MRPGAWFALGSATEPRTQTAPDSASQAPQSGLGYIALSITAVQILIRANSGGGTNSPKKTTGGVLDWTGGTMIVGTIGAILIGVALYQGHIALSKKFLRRLAVGRAGASAALIRRPAEAPASHALPSSSTRW